MPRNGSGVYTAPAASFPSVASTLIESAKYNDVVNDIATAVTASIAVDGQSTVTANIPLSGYKLTGVGAATARTDAASLATIQDGTGVYVATVGGTADVITLTPSPAITAYATGQTFTFIASGANTTNVTVNVSALGAKAITKNGTTALIAGDIDSGHLVAIQYDGTRFQIRATAVPTFGTAALKNTGTSGNTIPLLDGANTWSAVNTFAAGQVIRIPHTWAVPGEIKVPSGDTDYIVPFFVPVVGSKAVKLVACRYRINSGTSVTAKLQVNGSDATGFTGISVTTTAASTDPTDVALANNDLLALVVTAVSGTPKNMTFTALLEYQF